MPSKICYAWLSKLIHMWCKCTLPVCLYERICSCIDIKQKFLTPHPVPNPEHLGMQLLHLCFSWT